MAWRDEMRTTMPHGVWVCPDGTEILFNKQQRPLWQRRPGQAAEPAAKGKPDTIIAEKHFYGRHSLPWRDTAALRRCQAVLAEWGVPTPTVT